LTYPLSADAIDRAVALAVATLGAGNTAEDHRAALGRACGRVASPEPPRFARRAEATLGLGDVVLPPDRHAQLHEIVAHVRCAPQVLETWGFGAQLPYGRGVAALFHGPSGTGKTMAAQAIANALGAELYVVDLSRVVSKYIGESEKNLDSVFTDAERSGAVLLFDEADALFGKRSEIKDAHDRYANIEVAYLLQRMEAYAGLAVLTSNYRQNLDPAFTRRLRFIVEFPKPDAHAREQIWKKCLPAAAPLAKDVDLRLLARRVDVAGGTIRLATLRAAFAAAEERAPAIEMRHIIKATVAEVRKLGMPTAERDLIEIDSLQQRQASACAV
jgi:SpoVK/Ycf46/Vps4 family AAA+-type ATPase